MKLHWEWWEDSQKIKNYVKRTGETGCGRKAKNVLIAESLKEVTCKQCQQVYLKCEREGYWD